MTTTSIQTVIHERVDPVLEAMISGLVESVSSPKTSAQTKGAATEALALALVGAVMTPPSLQWSRTRGAVTPLEAFLASAFAAALAPALAQSLTPRILEVLGTRASTEKPGQEAEKSDQERTGQEAASREGAEQQEQHQ